MDNHHSIRWTRRDDMDPGYGGDPADFFIVIDGRVSDYLFDCAAMLVSSEKDGIFPIAVCTCGILGCGGLYVTVKHQDDMITWEKFWFCQCVGEPEPDDALEEFGFTKDFSLKPPLIFNKKEYQQIAEEIKEASVNNGVTWMDEALKRYRSGDVAKM